MKSFFKPDDWDEETDKLSKDFHFNTKRSIVKKLKKKKSEKVQNPPQHQEQEPTISNEIVTERKTSKNSETTHLLKNSPLIKNVSIKKAKKSNENEKISKTAKKKMIEKLKKSEPVHVIPSQFAGKLRETLKGGRFRFLNERLYTIKGNEAKKMFEQDLQAFTSYHEGYRQQVEKWPFNPLERMIKKIRKCPKNFVIADFGCGEARLAQSVQHKVFSIDLVSSRSDVIACDMANTSLTTGSIDVALYCLSLMGTNLNEFLLEANRVLKSDSGFLYIAEIASRFDNVHKFIHLVEKFGFKLLNKDLGNKYFYFFDFIKNSNCIKTNELNEIDLKLKPCIYKKR